MRTTLSRRRGGDKQDVAIDRKGRTKPPQISSKRKSGSQSGWRTAQLCRITCSRGFTLPELLIVVGLVGIIVGIAIPGYKNFSTKANMETSVDKLTRGISFSRNRALTSFPNTSVVICPSSNTDNTSPTCDADTSTDYSVGWITFIDCNDNSTYQSTGNLCDTDGDGTADAAEPLLQTQPGFNGLSIESADNTRIEFYRTGQAEAATSFSITKDGETFADIAMNAIGRVAVTPNTSFYE